MLIDVQYRKWMAEVLGHKLTPSIREIHVLRECKRILINEGLIHSVLEIAVYCTFARIVFAAREFGGDAHASTVAASTAAVFVAWGASETICRRVAALQGITFP